MTMTKAARFKKITDLGCIVCKNHHHIFSPCCIHHLTGIKFRRAGKKANDSHTIWLCPSHHQGRLGIHHMGMRAWEELFGTQESLLEQTNEAINA